MNFQTLLKIEDPEFYIDLAFRRAKEKSGEIRSSKLKGTRMEKSRYIETRKIEIIKDTIVEHLKKVLVSYPSIDQLPEFYLELVKCTLDYVMLKKSLGALGWAIKRTDEMFRIYASKINKCNDLQKINQYRREFYGRFSSILKQIRDELGYLEQARKIMKGFPTVKTSLPTVAIAGFPNVGKTTLLYELTGSKPEINDYAFTTKGINIGYYTKDKKKIQLLDTPGTLNRFNKMNNIEKQAYLAMKYVADKIIYIFDLTEPYPLKDQLKLYNRLKKENSNIIVYMTKKKLIDRKTFDEFKKKDYIDSVEGIKRVLVL